MSTPENTFVVGEGHQPSDETKSILDRIRGGTDTVMDFGKTVASNPVVNAVGETVVSSATHATQLKIGKEVMDQLIKVGHKVLPANVMVHLDTELGRALVANVLNMGVAWLQVAEVGTKPVARLSELAGREVIPADVAKFITEGMATHTMIEGLNALELLDKLMRIVPAEQLKQVVSAVYGTSANSTEK